MLTLQIKLARLGAALNAAVPGLIGHYIAPREEYPRGSWQEDGEGSSFRTDFSNREQLIHGTLDYYTLTEYDANIDAIQNALNGAELGLMTWRINSVQYEEESKLIHYEWEWETAVVDNGQ